MSTTVSKINYLNMSDVEYDEVLKNKSTTYGSKCEMTNCRSNLDPNSKKSFFRFPLQDYFCSQWVFSCARPDLVDLYLRRGSIFLYKTKKICEDHFTKDDFRNPDLLSQGLFKGVVPTMNLPELKTTVQIICHNKESPIIEVIELDDSSSDSIKVIPVGKSTQPKLKRSLRIYENKQKNSNFLSENKIRSNDASNSKTSNSLQHSKPSKRGRPRKNKN